MEGDDASEQLKVAAEYGQALLRQNEQLQRENAALRLEVQDITNQQEARMRQQATSLVEPLQRRVEELEDTALAGEASRRELQKLLEQRDAALETRDGDDGRLHEELAAAQSEAAAATARAAELGERLAAADRLREAAARGLEELQAAAAADRQRLAETEEQLTRVGAERDSEAAARKAAREEQARASELHAELERRETALLAELEEARGSSGAAADEVSGLREQLIATKAANATLQTKVESLDQMLDSMNSMAGGMGGDGGSLGAELAAEEADEHEQEERPDVETKMLVLQATLTALVMERDSLYDETERLKRRASGGGGGGGEGSPGAPAARYEPPTSGPHVGAAIGRV